MNHINTPPTDRPKRVRQADPNAPRRGLRLEEAAQYIGVGATLFQEMVKDGRMPQPKKIETAVVWDIRKLDFYFDNLPDRRKVNGWDVTCGFASGTEAAP